MRALKPERKKQKSARKVEPVLGDGGVEGNDPLTGR